MAKKPSTTPISGKCAVVMVRNMPLGNGTRTKGEVVGTAEAVNGTVDLEKFSPAKGFEAIEVEHLKLNPGLIKASTLKDAETDKK